MSCTIFCVAINYYNWSPSTTSRNSCHTAMLPPCPSRLLLVQQRSPCGTPLAAVTHDHFSWLREPADAENGNNLHLCCTGFFLLQGRVRLGNNAIFCVSKQEIRYLYSWCWTYEIVVGSFPAHNDVANTDTNNPQSLVPHCSWTFW